MMDKQQRIDYFLNAMMWYRSKNYNNPLTHDQVYSSLTKFDIKKEDVSLDASIDGTFLRWQQDFYYHNNIDVFVSPNWPYFCQFVNQKEKVLSTPDQIKVYIPLDGDHLMVGVERIFDFLEKNNIPHISKVGKHIRFDDVVVRLENQVDAQNLALFLKNDAYIQGGLIQNNPFAVEKDRIAYASDNKISYNSTVAALISLYINDAYNQNKDRVSCEDFRNFILDYYNKVIANGYNLKKLATDMGKRGITAQTSYNYMRVVELLYQSMDPNFTFQDYLEHFQKNVYDYYRQPEIIPQKFTSTEDTYVLSDERAKEEQVYSLMKKALIEFGKKKTPEGNRKYSYDDVVAQLEKYFETGNSKYITNSSGLRDEFVQYDFKNMVKSYVSVNNISFGDILLSSKKQVLDDALVTFCERYGSNCDLGAGIKKLLETGYYNGFTRTNNSRDNMQAAVSSSDISRIIMKEMNYPLTLNLMSFSKEERDMMIDKYVDTVIKNKYGSGHYSM